MTSPAIVLMPRINQVSVIVDSSSTIVGRARACPELVEGTPVAPLHNAGRF
jgi:hypothetical protein